MANRHSTLPADLRAGVEPSEIVTTIDGLSNKNYTMQACEEGGRGWRSGRLRKEQEDDENNNYG